MFFRLFLLTLAALAVQGQKTAESELQLHLDYFQVAIDEGLKLILKPMMPDEEQSDELIQALIEKHKAVHMKVSTAEYSLDHQTITGKFIAWKTSGESLNVDVIIKKSEHSASGFKFIAMHGRPSVIRRRQFSTCLVGFIWCYLYLIDIMPGSVEEIFGR